MSDIPALSFTAFGEQTGLNAANKTQVQRHWHSGVASSLNRSFGIHTILYVLFLNLLHQIVPLSSAKLTKLFFCIHFQHHAAF
jgi:hypothetical protein